MDRKIEKTTVVTFNVSDIEIYLKQAANMPMDSTVNFQFRYEEDEAYLVSAEVRHADSAKTHLNMNSDAEAARARLNRNRGRIR
jgi:hypothetical protein